MAKSNFNVVTHGLSGLVGDMLVFRQKANKTIVANRPRPSKKEPSFNMLEVRKKFSKAALYAKSVMYNPVLKAAYQAVAKIGESAFNRAFKDYQLAPEVDDANVSGYTGQAGELIIVSAIDDFKVVTVHVAIKDPSDMVIEEGESVQGEDGLNWVYTTTTALTSVSGNKVQFTASDMAGNKTLLEVIIP